jgi:hypothetical protein
MKILIPHPPNPLLLQEKGWKVIWGIPPAPHQRDQASLDSSLFYEILSKELKLFDMGLKKTLQYE